MIKIIQSAVTEYYSYYNSKVTLTLSRKINIKVLAKASRIKLRDFENAELYDIISRAQNQDGSQIVALINGITTSIKEIITIVSTIAVLAAFRWWLIVVCVSVPVIKSFIAIKIDKAWFELKISRTNIERRCWYIKYLFTTGAGIREMRLFQFCGDLITRYNDIQKRIISQDLNITKKTATFMFISELVSAIAMGASIAYVSVCAILKKILIGDVAAFIECMETISESTESIFMGLEGVVNESMYIGLLTEYLDLEEESSKQETIEDIKTIELKNVSFSYKDEVEVLSNVNLFLRKGDCIKLIGNNGSGKTSLVNIIAGIYDDYKGNIYVNGIDLKTINKESYFSCISCVFQNFQKFETSIRNNLTFGKDAIPDDIIYSNLKAVDLDNKIKEIGGLDTVIGNWFGEYQLSSGEWQRIAIARAITKNAHVLIMDEPDSALDENSKNSISAITKGIQAAKDQIVIKISHQEDSNLSDYTYVYKLANGKLIKINS